MAVDNKAVLRRLYEELFGRGNVSVIDELFAPSFVDRTFAPGKEAGLDEIKQAFVAFRTAFPDARVQASLRLRKDTTHTPPHPALSPRGEREEGRRAQGGAR